MTTMPNTNWVLHDNPVWHDKANFIINARVYKDEGSPQWGWEQLWARQLGADRFEICCIPFFLYDLALGDEVQTGLKGEDEYVLQRVVKQSGHYTFRVWFGNSEHPNSRSSVPEELERLGCLMEWNSPNLMAVDAPESLAQEVANLLYSRQQLGYLHYETSRRR